MNQFLKFTNIYIVILLKFFQLPGSSYVLEYFKNKFICN